MEMEQRFKNLNTATTAELEAEKNELKAEYEAIQSNMKKEYAELVRLGERCGDIDAIIRKRTGRK